MQTIGNITLNISLVIYLLYFVPQAIHNQIKHNTINISLWTHSLMILANSLDLIYSIGFNMQWQYILADIILLSFLAIQQIQILSDRRQKNMFIHTVYSFLFLTCITYASLFLELSSNFLLVLGCISGIVYNIYWFPQIYKNYKSKNAQGFSISCLLLTFINSICDSISSITLAWPLTSILTSLFLIFLVSIQVYQYHYYKK